MPDGSTQTRLRTGVFNGSERPSGFFCRLLKAATSDAQGTRFHDQVLNPPICYPLQCVNCEPVGPIAQWLEQATHNRLVGGSNPSGPTISNRHVCTMGSCTFPLPGTAHCEWDYVERAR